jgi:hypothetical protein
LENAVKKCVWINVIKDAGTALASFPRMTDCSNEPLLFANLGDRKVIVEFSAGDLSSDGGALLLRQVDHGLGLSRALAACFHDTRDARFVDHSLPQLLAQRLYGLALGYEDLNDHAALRRDPLLAAACDKLDPLGQDRLMGREPRRGKASASSLRKILDA